MLGVVVIAILKQETDFVEVIPFLESRFLAVNEYAEAVVQQPEPSSDPLAKTVDGILGKANLFQVFDSHQRSLSAEFDVKRRGRGRVHFRRRGVFVLDSPFDFVGVHRKRLVATAVFARIDGDSVGD